MHIDLCTYVCMYECMRTHNILTKVSDLCDFQPYDYDLYTASSSLKAKSFSFLKD